MTVLPGDRIEYTHAGRTLIGTVREIQAGTDESGLPTTAVVLTNGAALDPHQVTRTIGHTDAVTAKPITCPRCGRLRERGETWEAICRECDPEQTAAAKTKEAEPVANPDQARGTGGGKCIDCGTEIPTRGGRKRCDECKREEARRRWREKDGRKRQAAKATPAARAEQADPPAYIVDRLAALVNATTVYETARVALLTACREVAEALGRAG